MSEPKKNAQAENALQAEADTSSVSAQNEGENLTPTQQKAARAAAEAEEKGHHTPIPADEDAR